MSRARTATAPGVQSAVIALRILEYLASQGEPSGVTALASALQTTKNRAHRHLRNLVDQGYVVQLPSDKYGIGARLVALGRAVRAQHGLGLIADAAMRQLRDALGHRVYLAQPEAHAVRVVASVAGRSVIEIGVKDGALLELHTTAVGKVALAFGEEALREAVLREPLRTRTAKSIVTPAALRRELARIRQQGWAVSPNEFVIGLNAVAAPIFEASGALAATVAIVDSVQFIPPVPSAEQVRETLLAARRISAALGYRGK